ncbi:MAG: serine acetyltransferase [Chitinophagaceae bacterium]|nr:serine acetyltransferase [Chitinophagaceae bacterium]
MNEKFYRSIFEKQQQTEDVPPNEVITDWAVQLIRLLYPERSKQFFSSSLELEAAFKKLESGLASILDNTSSCKNSDNAKKAKKIFEGLPGIYQLLNTDITAIVTGDPAARSEFEVIRTYPGFFAICFYRIAHSLLKQDIPFLPRTLTEYAHSQTGIDIHPAAEIGKYLCIDHGTGIVIGETCKIGDHVKIYQGVTLGALSVDKNMAFIKRHPTVEDHVIIYSGATILGGETIIGEHSIIGGNVWLTKSVAPYSSVYHRATIEVVDRKLID